MDSIAVADPSILVLMVVVLIAYTPLSVCISLYAFLNRIG